MYLKIKLEVSEALDFHNEACDSKVKELQSEIDKCWDKIDDLENRARRNNIVLFNIPEGSEANPSNCIDFVNNLITEFIDPNIPEGSVDIQRAHRTPTGPPRPGQIKPRPIHVYFNQFSQKEMVRKAAIPAFKATKYKNCKLFVAEDISKRLQNKRKEMFPTFKKLREEGKRPFFSYPAILKYWENGAVKVFKITPDVNPFSRQNTPLRSQQPAF